MPHSTSMIDLFVSIQDPGAADPSKGHLAAGLLIDGDTVVVPREATDNALPGRFDVLLFRKSPGPGGPVERLRPSSVTWRVPSAGEDSTVAVVSLERPSRYGASLDEETSLRLAALFARGRDLWDGLEELRMIPDGFRAGPPREVWDAVFAAGGAPGAETAEGGTPHGTVSAAPDVFADLPEEAAADGGLPDEAIEHRGGAPGAGAPGGGASQPTKPVSGTGEGRRPRSICDYIRNWPGCPRR